MADRRAPNLARICRGDRIYDLALFRKAARTSSWPKGRRGARHRREGPRPSNLTQRASPPGRPSTDTLFLNDVSEKQNHCLLPSSGFCVTNLFRRLPSQFKQAAQGICQNNGMNFNGQRPHGICEHVNIIGANRHPFNLERKILRSNNPKIKVLPKLLLKFRLGFLGNNQSPNSRFLRGSTFLDAVWLNRTQ